MQRVTEHVIPQKVRDLAPSVDDFWSLVAECGGWDMWKSSDYDGNDMFMHRNCEMHDHPDKIPKFLKGLEQWEDNDIMISVFVSHNPATKHALQWHVDQYEVFAFNLEGETRWDWFDLHTGTFKSIYLGEMDKLIHMPFGYSHRVEILSEGRTSISLVKPMDFRNK